MPADKTQRYPVNRQPWMDRGPNMGNIRAIFLVILCLSGSAKSGPKRREEQSADRPGHIWDGPCGKPSPSGAQWLSISPNFQSTSNPDALMHAMEKHIVGTTEAIALSMPWNMAIRYPKGTIERRTHFYRPLHVGAAALIRARPGLDESDFAVTNYFTCKMIRRHQEYFEFGFLPEPPSAVFGAYDLRRTDTIVVPIKRCYQTYQYINRDNAGLHGIPTKRAVGIIQLSRAVPFTGAIRPVCMPEADETIQVGTALTVGAWGNPDDKDKAATLRRSNVRMADQSCKNQLLPDQADDLFCIEAHEWDVNQKLIFEGGPILSQREDGAFVMSGIAQVNNADQGGLDNLVTSVPYFIKNGWIEGMIRYLQAQG